MFIYCLIPVYIIKSVGDFVDDFNSMFYSQRGHHLVPAQAVGLCVIFVGHLRHVPLIEKLWEYVLRFPSHDKQPEGGHTPREHESIRQQLNI